MSNAKMSQALLRGTPASRTAIGAVMIATGISAGQRGASGLTG
jgi:hypothetical protein